MKDLTKPQFEAALKRYGLKVSGLWVQRDGDPTFEVGIRCHGDGRLNRRATLAKAVNRFNAYPVEE